jgi:hypothetical protein
VLPVMYERHVLISEGVAEQAVLCVRYDRHVLIRK